MGKGNFEYIIDNEFKYLSKIFVVEYVVKLQNEEFFYKINGILGKQLFFN